MNGNISKKTLAVATTAAILALIKIHGAVAQEQNRATDSASAMVLEEVTVTGSRVKRDGYSSPTAETVLSAEEINASAPATIADFVNELPALAGSITPRHETDILSAGTAGSNFLNLRGLGPTRSLVLLDGRRVAGATIQGVPDINNLPSALINRVDIVTGGASAAWGSDAVSGVVNFELDTDYEGIKGSVQAGQSGESDADQYRLELAAGTAFAEGRGHILFSATRAENDGVLQASDRDWFKAQKMVANPDAGQPGAPALIKADNVVLGIATYGGLINSGVLAGTEFIEGGAQREHQYGVRTSIYDIGGQGNEMAGDAQLSIPLEQDSYFGRLSYAVSDILTVYTEASYASTLANGTSFTNLNFGTAISRDNPFLDPDLAARMDAAGETSFGMGILPLDLGFIRPRNKRDFQRFVIGADGILPNDWSYSVYAQQGKSEIDLNVRILNEGNWSRAVDAVRNTDGEIVCRVNQTAVVDPACAPYNPMGLGLNNSQAATDYVLGNSRLDMEIEQRVVSGLVQGDLFVLPTGPVSVAFGAEYRKEEVNSSSDPESQADAFLAGNYKPTNGSYDVKEVFAEAVVPLLSGRPLVHALDLNAAVRYTDYSTSGGVDTWKIGANWSFTEDLRLRATVSRDIRAPNLGELFEGGQTSTQQTVFDPVTGLETSGVTAVTVGNDEDLQPEEADSFTLGLVYRPAWLPGFGLTVDYYEIEIEDAIVSVGTQEVVDRCAGGNTSFCNDISRNEDGLITDIVRRPRNFAGETVEGIDFEARYATDVGPGVLSARLFTSFFLDRTSSDGFTEIDWAGVNIQAGGNPTVPDWRLMATLRYDINDFGAQLTARSVSDGVYDNSFTAEDLADNSIDGETYFDLAMNYKLPLGSVDGELFFTVDNVFDTDPVIVYPMEQQFLAVPANALYYDTLGRMFRAGFRFEF